jgi:hypothetical protein
VEKARNAFFPFGSNKENRAQSILKSVAEELGGQSRACTIFTPLSITIRRNPRDKERRGDAALTFTIAGTVPVTNLQTPLPAGKVTTLANRFPVDLRLSELKLDQMPGWIANRAAAAADSVLIHDGLAWRAYYFNGVDWLSEETASAPQDSKIAFGTSVLVVRLPGSDATLDQTPPYWVIHRVTPQRSSRLTGDLSTLCGHVAAHNGSLMILG